MFKKLQFLLIIALFTVTTTASFASNYETISTNAIKASYLSKGEQEIYVIKPISSGTYYISTAGGVDTYGVLYNSSNEPIMINDNGSEYEYNFGMEVELSVYETYYLQVSGYTEEENGMYSLHISRSDYDSYSTKNLIDVTEKLSTNKLVSGTITRGDEVYYTFVPPTSGTYTFASYGDVDTYGVLFNTDYVVVDENDDSDDSYNNFAISADLEAGETYYLMISGYSYYDAGEYHVKAVKGEMAEVIDDSAFLLEDASDLTLDISSALTLDYGDIKLYKIIPEITGDYTLMSTGDVDTYGTLYDGDNNWLADNDDAAYADENFRIDASLEAGKTYYLSVEGYTYYDTGETTVKWLNTSDAPEVDTDDGSYYDAEYDWAAEWDQTATELPLGEAVAGTVTSGEENIYRITIANTGVYTIASDSAIDVYGALYDGDGYYIDMSDDVSDDDYDFSLDIELEAGETYYLFLGGYTYDDYGDYTVSVISQ